MGRSKHVMGHFSPCMLIQHVLSRVVMTCVAAPLVPESIESILRAAYSQACLWQSHVFLRAVQVRAGDAAGFHDSPT